MRGNWRAPAMSGNSSPRYSRESLPTRIIVNSPFSQRHLISYGLAVFALDTRRWLLVRPLTTPNFSSIVRGFYRVSELKNMTKHIVHVERESLLTCLRAKDSAKEFENLYARLFALHAPEEAAEDARDRAYALQRFLDARRELLSALESDECAAVIEWTWPKGRRNGANETNLETAVREFEEESGISSRDIHIITNEPLVEFYKSNNGRVYETQCWVGVVEREAQLPPITAVGEIGDRRWIDEDEITRMFSPIEGDMNLSHSSRLAHFEAFKRAIDVYREQTEDKKIRT